MDNARQDFDDLVWDRNDEAWEEAKKEFSKKSTCRRLEGLVSEKFGKPATWITPMIIGGFNNLYRFHVEDVPAMFWFDVHLSHNLNFSARKLSTRSQRRSIFTGILEYQLHGYFITAMSLK
jgi:hypothetical protein